MAIEILGRAARQATRVDACMGLQQKVRKDKGLNTAVERHFIQLLLSINECLGKQSRFSTGFRP
jgi:hypothetical protein